jgi:hypothetical protein
MALSQYQFYKLHKEWRKMKKIVVFFYQQHVEYADPLAKSKEENVAN